MGHYNQNSFETKDDAPNMNDIMREVKSFGSDVKNLKTSMASDINAVRELAESAKGISPELEAKFTEITTSVLAKQEAIDTFEAKNNERMDLMETALNRMPTGGNADNGDQMTKAAVDYFSMKAAIKGTLSFKDRPNAESIDMDGYKAWDQHFGTYMRVDDRGMMAADEQKALSVGSNPNGGYLVPTQRSARIIEAIHESSPLRALATVETIGTEALEIPLDLDEAGYGWAGEEETSSETGTPQVGMMRIPVHEMTAKPKATQQAIEDAAIDIEAWLERKVSERFGRAEAFGFIRGTGIKMPRGILSYDTGAESSRGTVKAINSGHATQLTADGLVKMPFNLKGAYMSRGSWMMNRMSVLGAMLLKDADGQYMWRAGLTEGAKSTLLGHSISMADDMPTLAANSLSVAFGDWKRAYTVVDRLGITILRDQYSSKPFVEFYTRKRVGGDVTDFEAYVLMKTAA